jgi:hypothetical protein
MKTGKPFFVASFLLFSFLVLPAVRAEEPFIDDRTGVMDDYFQQSFANHTASLDTLASNMRRDHDYSNLSNAHRHLTNMQAIQTDTGQQMQNSFMNTQTSAIFSGGLRNGNPSSGMNYMYMMNSGMMGNNNQVVPSSWGSSGNQSSNSYGSGNYYGSPSRSVNTGW